MADNYLEKRMEDYRNGNLKSAYHTSSRLTSPRRKPGEVSLAACNKVVLLAMTDTGMRNAIALPLAAAGLKVAFCGTSPSADAAFAQRNSLIHCPVEEINSGSTARMAAIVEHRCGSFPMILTDGQGRSSSGASSGGFFTGNNGKDAAHGAIPYTLFIYKEGEFSHNESGEDSSMQNNQDVKSSSIIEIDSPRPMPQNAITAVVNCIVAAACTPGVEILTKLKIRGV